MTGNILTDYTSLLFGQLVDPGKRIFLLYLLSSVIIAVTWLHIRQKISLPKIWSHLTDRRVWLGSSSRSDLFLILFNQAISMLLAPVLLGRLAVATALYFLLTDFFKTSDPLVDSSESFIAVLFTATYFVIDDWSRYRLHRLLHEIPALWFFHKIHHSARTMSPLTVYRVHPVEGILFSLRGVLVQGCVTAVFVFVFGGQISLVSVLGASIFTFLFNIAGSNLRHSHIRVVYWPWLEKILISPSQHQLHHSSASHHFNKNYGSTLAIWDFFGKSLIQSAGQSKPRLGLARRPHSDENKLSTLTTKPFVELYEYVRQQSMRKATWFAQKTITRNKREYRKS